MRITKQTGDRMVIKGDRRRIKRNVIYGAIVVVVFIVPAVIYFIVTGLSLETTSGLIKALVFPIVALVGVATVLYHEGSRIVIDKARGRLVVRRPVNKEMAGTYPLRFVAEVRLRYHGNPYYFPKMSIVFNNDEEIILSSDVLLSMPGPGPLFKAPPMYGHVKREQDLGRDIASFMGVPFREIQGGDVTFGLDQADKEVFRADRESDQ